MELVQVLRVAHNICFPVRQMFVFDASWNMSGIC